MVGQTVSHYEITEKIGKGGMGVVYKAHDIKLDRTVALKFLPSHLGADEFEKQRFLNEAKAASALDHPNICSIFSIEETDDGNLFIVMAYYDGMPLKRKMEWGHLPLNDVINYVLQIAAGLQKAHDKGIVHRDLKPANIFITTDDQIKIIDFGLAKAAQQTVLTKPGTTLGTVPYMSPEQAQGSTVDHRTDIWSFGVLMYEMLTGQLPFRSEYETAVVYSIINEDPVPVTDISPGVSVSIETIVMKCLEKDPDHRYQQINDMAQELHQINQSSDPEDEKRKDIPSIAVLPFVNMNRNDENEFFCDGITEDISMALIKLDGLKVAAHNSSFQFKGKPPDLKEVGKTLRVNTVLMGSLRSAGNRLRFNVQLSDVKDGYVIWSERYDRVMEDIFDIQDQISHAVVDALKVELVGNEKQRLKKRSTEDIEAYNLYLKGRYYWNQRTPESIQKAKQHFERALAEDDNYALAHSGKADCFGSLGIFGVVSPQEVLDEGRTAALKAIEIDPELAEGHTSLAFIEAVYNWNWEFADRKFQQAEALDPKYALAPFWRAIFVLSQTGRHDEALAEAHLARRLAPTVAFIDSGLLVVYFFAHQFDNAIRAAKQTLELDPGYHYANFYLGRALVQKGEVQNALGVFDKLKDVSMKQGCIGYTYAVAGEKEKAYKILNNMVKSDIPDYNKAYHIALIHSGLNERDQVFHWLEKAYGEHSTVLYWNSRAPEFNNVRNDSRWKNLMDRIGLPV